MMKRKRKHRPWQFSQIQCPGCGRWHPYGQYLDAAGNPVGRLKHIGPHCSSCHSDRHNACVVCGQCLPPWRPGVGPHWEKLEAARIDARYCSSACRQRAYRRRRGLFETNKLALLDSPD